jgi:glyoxylate reductase
MPRVLVTRPIDPAAMAILEEAGLQAVVHAGDEPMGHAAIIEALAGCVALIPMPSDRIDAAVLAAGPLKVVANHAVGVDNIDRDAARRSGIVVTNTPGVLTEATAELTFALMLATARRVVEADRYLRDGRFAGWQPMLLRGLELHGATLGIVGMGRIGKAVAERAKAFGMRVVHHNRSSGMPLNTLLDQSDVVSLHCPLSASTRHLIGADELRRMKPSAILVNCARGPVVDEAALVLALESGELTAAGLDVFEEEPRVHPDLIGRVDVVLLPHIGSATVRCRRRMGELAAQNVVAVLRGEAPLHPA